MTESMYFELLSAAAAALRGEPVPLPEDPEETARRLYRLAYRHRIIGVLWPVILQWRPALPAAVFERWETTQTVLTVQAARQEAAAQQLAQLLRQERIPFVGLKGYVLQRLYPVLRTAADVDILVPVGERLRVRRLMRQRGYPLLSKGTNHDEYRMPGAHIELHHGLRDEEPLLRRYYRDIFRRLEPAEGSEMLMSPEEFLVFQTVHAAKHMTGSGMGIRMLLDQYVYTHFGPPVDMTVLRQQLELLGLWQFYSALEALNGYVLEPEGRDRPLPPDLDTLLEYICAGALFGKDGQGAAMADDREGKGCYLLHRAFPSFAFMKGKYALLGRLPVLLPFFWCWRLLTVLLRRDRHPAKAMKTVIAVSETARAQAGEIRRITGL